MKKIIAGVFAAVSVLSIFAGVAFAAPGGKIDLSDPRVIECSAANPDGGTAYWACLDAADVISWGGVTSYNAKLAK